MLEVLDPGNEYLSPAEYKRAANGQDAGPADVGLALSKRRGYAVVISARPRSPAAEAGLSTGDLLMSIDGRTTRKMGVWEAAQALRGKPGSKTTIVVNSADGSDKRTLALVRKTLGAIPPSGALVPPGVGVVRIAAIREGDARRLDQSIGALKSQGAIRLLLDLRGCVSDSLPEAVGMASLFIADGTVVTVTDRYDGDKAYRSDGRRQAWDRPMAVLVDEGTARTCEALAAALRDGLGVPVVGQRTWGLGTLQRLIPLSNGDGVLLAVGKLLSPAGKEWNGKGIEPDLQIPGSEADPGDPQRQKAIDYLRGLSASTRRNAA
jgi:carboxyl-terminal processing protease